MSFRKDRVHLAGKSNVDIRTSPRLQKSDGPKPKLYHHRMDYADDMLRMSRAPLKKSDTLDGPSSMSSLSPSSVLSKTGSSLMQASFTKLFGHSADNSQSHRILRKARSVRTLPSQSSIDSIRTRLQDKYQTSQNYRHIFNQWDRKALGVIRAVDV
jgi:hypothetical protein